MKFTKILAVAALFVALSAQSAFAQSAALRGFNDCSIASLSGSSQQLLPANPNRAYLLICNTAAANSAGINLAGGTAAIGGAGTFTLLANNVAGSCKEYAIGSYLPPPPANAITVIGTSTQSVLCLEGR